MGKTWDASIPGVEFWEEALRVAKPGSFLLAFGGTRTFHRLMCNIEEAGWHLRDTIMWIYSCSLPKSLDISKEIDKLNGVWRGKSGEVVIPDMPSKFKEYERIEKEKPVSGDAQKWSGWGTNLKPCFEPIVVARKPFDGTVTKNVLKWGCGGLNIDACRIEYQNDTDMASATPQGRCTAKSGALAGKTQHNGDRTEFERPELKGRFPGNLIWDGSPSIEELFPNSKTRRCDKPSDCSTDGNVSFDSMRGNRPARGYSDDGSAARFFKCCPPDDDDLLEIEKPGQKRFYYSPKASRKDRDEGCEDLESKNNMRVNAPRNNEEEKTSCKYKNNHPTVKSTNLMQYLCRLVTPKGGTILDCFMGSGSTGKAALLEGFNFIGIELDQDYCNISEKRISFAAGKKSTNETFVKSLKTNENKKVELVQKDLF
jgi:site-specific DNA-methyltransferase (adenine-specific)